MGTEEVAADDNFGLDDCLSTEDDVGGADYLTAAGDFVSCILWEAYLLVLWFDLGESRGEGDKDEEGGNSTVSMYSPLMGFLDMV